MSDGRELVEARGQGVGFTAPLAQSARFGDGVTRHHRSFFDDYNVAKLHITQAIGDLTELDIFDRNVLVAVFCRPNTMTVKRADGTEGAVYMPVKEIKEDWYQHKVVMVLKCGPDAFRANDDRLAQWFGDMPPPKPGEWLFANASSGIQVNICGEGASRPQGVDHRGATMDIYEWDGWPCRIVSDEQFLGRLERPHSVI